VVGLPHRSGWLGVHKPAGGWEAGHLAKALRLELVLRAARSVACSRCRVVAELSRARLRACDTRGCCRLGTARRGTSCCLSKPGGLLERREVVIETPFAGPGARDAFELVTRAVTEQRYHLDRSLARPALGPARERFVFRLRYRDQVVNVALRDGFVTNELVELADREHRSGAEEDRLTVLKAETAQRVLSARAEDVYDDVSAPQRSRQRGLSINTPGRGS
jgi:hypothetical protein